MTTKAMLSSGPAIIASAPLAGPPLAPLAVPASPWAQQRMTSMVITPAMAREWIAQTTLRNRALDLRKVKRFAEALRAGTFLCNGHTIVLDPAGQVLDGNSRLHAIILADTPLETYVVFGMDRNVFPSFDQGKPRTMANILDIAGEANYTQLSAALQWVWRYEQGLMASTSPDALPSRTALLDTLQRHPLLRESLVWGSRLHFLMPPSLGIACHYLFHARNALRAAPFFDGLETGINLNERSPVYWLRQRLLKQRKSKARLPTIEMAALVIKAWNAWVVGRPIHSLRWRTEGPQPEPFPRILEGTTPGGKA